MIRYIFNIIFIGLASGNILLAANLDSLMISANDCYTHGKYEDAVKSYEAIINQGFESDQLYFNLGNAYFKQKNIPASILYFEKALKLNPSDEDINFNLELAKTFTVDKIEPLPVFFLTKFLTTIRNIFSSNSWAVSSIAFLIVSLSLAALFWFTYSSFLKRISFSVGIITLVLCVMSIIFSIQQKNRLSKQSFGIVFPSVISVKSSPGESGKDLFILHSGTKVKVSNTIGDWIEIRIADGNKGWILSDAIQRI